MSQAPRVESRGGDRPDWEKVVMGEPLPEQDVEYPEPESEAAPAFTVQAGLARAQATAQGLGEPEAQ